MSDSARSAALSGPRSALDPRIHLARPGLVEIGLAGHVAAASYVAPIPMRCTAPRTAMRDAAAADATAISELLHGEAFDLFALDESGDWAFGRSVHDGYLGWLPIAALGDIIAPTHRITARHAPVFSGPDIKSAVTALLPMGSWISAQADGKFLATPDGYVHQAHVAALADTSLLAVARQYVGAPYVWGGRAPSGVDCSGLVQISLSFSGLAAPRDSDQQQALGIAAEEAAPGDLLFFPGHVGIMAEDHRLLHANAHWMAVVEEPLADVLARQGLSAPTAIRRLQAE